MDAATMQGPLCIHRSPWPQARQPPRLLSHSNVTLCRDDDDDDDSSSNGGCNGGAQARSSRREFNWMGARFSPTDYVSLRPARADNHCGRLESGSAAAQEQPDAAGRDLAPAPRGRRALLVPASSSSLAYTTIALTTMAAIAGRGFCFGSLPLRPYRLWKAHTRE